MRSRKHKIAARTVGQLVIVAYDFLRATVSGRRNI
jgi:hypothetical protein